MGELTIESNLINFYKLIIEQVEEACEEQLKLQF